MNGLAILAILAFLFVLILLTVRGLRRWHESNELIAMYERAQVNQAAAAYRRAVEQDRRWK